MKRKRPRKPQETKPVAPARVAEPVPTPTPWWAHAAVVLGLLLANLALYQGTFDLGFLSVDDPVYIQNNPYIESFSATNLTHILTTPYGANYAPVNLLSYSLDVALAKGKSAAAIHISNVVWHGFVVCMVYLLAFTLRPRLLTAAAAAGLFLLHPAHVEAVAWISSRKDLVATGFAALAMAAYLRYRRRGRGGGWWYAGGVLAFLLASAGKQSVLLLPAVMLVWDFLVEKRRNWRMVADKIPFGLITLFFGWMTWHAQPSTGQTLNPWVMAVSEFTNVWLLTGLSQYVLYRAAPDPQAWSQAARLAIMVGAVLVWALPLLFVWKRRPLCATLCYWFLIQMVPPMLLAFMIPITDRYLFLPSVGVCLLLAELAAGWEKRLPAARWLPPVLLAALGLVWGAKTWNYVEEWRDPRSVWYGAHLKTSNSQVQQFLGEVYQNAGDHMDSFVKTGALPQWTNEICFAQAVLRDEPAVERLRAEWTKAQPTRTNSLAYRDQLWNFAWQRFDESVARRGTLIAPNLFTCRGRLLVNQGKFAQAIPEFQTSLAMAQISTYAEIRYEGMVHALFNIGVCYWNLNNYGEAQTWLLRAQAVQRESGRVWLPNLDQEVEVIKRLAAKK